MRLTLTVLLFSLSPCFYFELHPNIPNCFILSSTENILVDLFCRPLPINTSLHLTVTGQSNTLYNNSITPPTKLSLRPDYNSMEYEVCLRLSSPEALLVWLELLSSFAHKLTPKEPQVTISHSRIVKYALRLKELSQSQVDMHRHSQEMEKQTQALLESIAAHTVTLTWWLIALVLLCFLSRAQYINSKLNSPRLE